MTSRYIKIALWSLGVLLLLSWDAFFMVDQTQQVLVLQFGELQRVHDTPGLKIKIPFIQEVVFYERRVLDFDSLTPVRITTSDQKRVLVDFYTRYRIQDPLLFFRSIKPANEFGARSRLEVIVSSTVRNVLGRATLRALLAEEREPIMKSIHDEVTRLGTGLGLGIVDVRIVRTELPTENRKAVFARMNSELLRIAKENRAKGAEMAQGIKSGADKERTIILADAEKLAQITRGEADAKAAEVSAKALGRDPKFYAFYRTLQIYREAFNEQTTLVLTTDSDVLKLFASSPGEAEN